MLQKIKLILSLVLFAAIWSNCQEPGQFQAPIGYEPVYVPIPRGPAVQVGTFVISEGLNLSGGEVTMNVIAASPLEKIRLVVKTGANESMTIAEDSLVLGKIHLRLRGDLPAGTTRIGLYLEAAGDHDLRDRPDIQPESFTLGQQSFSVSHARKVPAYRMATALRTFGDDGFAAYRIPGLVTTPRGTLLAVYDIRRNSSRDLQGDIDVGLSRSTDGGITWEPMRVIMDMGEWGGRPQDENGIGDPAVLVDPETGHIWVAALWGHGKPGQMVWGSSQPGVAPTETGQFMVVTSEDDGLTWSSPRSLTPGVKNPEWFLFFNGPGKGITLQDGTLVFPAQFKDKEQMPHSTLIYSKDKGLTWSVGTGAKSNTTEAQVVALEDGSLMLNMRDNRGGSRSVAVTSDFGQTWKEHPTSRTALPEPVCMASLIDNPYRPSMLLFSNPATDKGRYNITIKASLDDGNTWPTNLQLLLDEGKGWGYSCLTMINEHEVGILYEGSIANLVFQIIPLKDLIGPQ
jgi:sialidase-1